MKKTFLQAVRFSHVAAALILLLGGAQIGCAQTTRATATLPFKVEVIEVPSSALPPVHSYSSATAEGKWLILGGRIAGLHGFANSKDNFPRSSANTYAYVIDPVANKVLGSVDLVKALPPQLAGPLTATNPEFVQVGGNLFIVGGYGMDLKSGDLTTFGSITRLTSRV